MSDDVFTKADREWFLRMKDFIFGNGNKGAGDRLTVLEKVTTEEGKCAVGKALKRHMDEHKANKLFRWGTMVPIYIILLTLLLQIIGVIK